MPVASEDLMVSQIPSSDPSDIKLDPMDPLSHPKSDGAV